MLGLKKEQFKLVNANVKPFLDFKPGFEFNVKGKHLADKKSAPAKFRWDDRIETICMLMTVFYGLLGGGDVLLFLLIRF